MRPSLVLVPLFLLASASLAEPFKHDPDALTFEDSKKIFKSQFDVSGAFKSKKKILIAGYRVGFLVSGGAASFDKGQDTQISNFSGKDRVTYYIDNPDTVLSATATVNYDLGLLREITEEAYADLVARLKAVGRETVSMESLRETEGYKALELAKPDAEGNFPSSNDNGGLADTNYIAFSPKDVPMWFMGANPLDQGGALSKAASALAMKNMGAWKQLGVDADAVSIDLSFIVRPAFVYGVRKKFLRPAAVGVDPFLVVIPEPIAVHTHQKTWVGVLPKAAGSLMLTEGPGNTFKDAKDYPFNYGYDYGTLRSKEEIKDVTVFEKAFDKSIRVDITPDREKFKAAVLNALKTTNATLALWAKEYPAE